MKTSIHRTAKWTALSVAVVTLAACSSFMGGGEATGMVGRKAPDFYIETSDGDYLTRASLEGKVVVLDFWASWCGPCVKALPELDKVYRRFADNPNVQFVAVSVDDDRTLDNAYQFIQRNRIAMPMAPVAGTGNPIAEQFKVRGIPHMVIIDPDGIIHDVKIGFSSGSIADIESTVAAFANPV